MSEILFDDLGDVSPSPSGPPALSSTVDRRPSDPDDSSIVALLEDTADVDSPDFTIDSLGRKIAEGVLELFGDDARVAVASSVKDLLEAIDPIRSAPERVV